MPLFHTNFGIQNNLCEFTTREQSIIGILASKTGFKLRLSINNCTCQPNLSQKYIFISCRNEVNVHLD